MKKQLFAILCSLFLAATAHAQWDPSQVYAFCPAHQIPDPCGAPTENPYIVGIPEQMEIAWDNRTFPECPGTMQVNLDCIQIAEDILHSCICEALQNYLEEICACGGINTESGVWQACKSAARSNFDAALAACNDEWVSGTISCCELPPSYMAPPRFKNAKQIVAYAKVLVSR